MSDARPTPTILLAWVGVALLFVYFVFLGGAPAFQAFPQVRAITHVITFLTVLVVLVLGATGRVSLSSPLLIPGLAWVLVSIAATVTSARPEASREATALLLLAVPSYLVIRTVVWSESLRRRTQWLLIATASALVVLYLGQVLTQWVGWWSAVGPSLPPIRPGSVGLTLGSGNTVSLYLELLLPIAVWLSWTRWRSRVFTLSLALLGLAALLISGSRGAWLGAIVGAILLATLVVRRSGSGAIRRRLTSAPRGIVAAIGAVAVGTLLVGAPILIGRLAGGDAGRLELWDAALAIGGGAPLLGVGPGAWQGLRPLEHVSEANLAVVYTPHNVVLQTFVDAGIVGVIAGTWLIVATVVTAMRSIRRDSTYVGHMTKSIALASLTAAAVHSIVDPQFEIPGAVVLMFVLVAQFDEPPATASPQSTADRTRAAIGIAAVLIGAAILVPIDIASLRAEAGDRLLDAGRAEQALAEYEAAVGLHDLPIYRLGEAIARSGIDDLDGTAAALGRVVDREPLSFTEAQLALANLMNGDREAAGALARKVVESGSYDPAATLGAAAVFAHLGDEQAATEALTSVMVQVPSLVYSKRPAELFNEDIWVAAQLGAIERLGETDPVRAATVAIRAGLTDVAAQYVGAVPPGPERDMLDLLDQAVTTGSTDLPRARAIVRANPTSSSILGLLWELGFATGSQADIDLVSAISVPLFFNIPPPPYEIVADGRSDSDASIRLPRYPSSASNRLGPKRPYIRGYPTIEPVFRPK